VLVSRLVSIDPLAVGFFALGGFLLYQALQLSMRSLDGGPGPGLLPAALGVLMLVFSGRLLVASVVEPPSFGSLVRLGIMVAALVVFSLALDRLGFLLTSAAVMVVLLVVFNNAQRAALAALGVVGAAATYGLFYVLLRVPLPPDPWGLWR